MRNFIYKIAEQADWEKAIRSGAYEGAEIDRQDDFIHFSNARQLKETARKHFAHQTDLILVEVDPDQLGMVLKWEPSRGGDLFPHLYGSLMIDQINSHRPLTRGADGLLILPEAI